MKEINDLTIPVIGELMEQDRINRLQQQVQEERDAINKGMKEIGNGSIKMVSNAYGRNYSSKTARY